MAAPPFAAGNKKLLIIGVVVVLLLIGAAAGWFIVSRSHAADDDEGGAPASRDAPAPTFLPLDNMVVNLADPGGDRFIQLGITLDLENAKTAELIRQHLPAIRSSILLLVSQRTSAELLQREGKEKLAIDIRREVSRPLGYPVLSEREAAEQRPQEEDAQDRAMRRRRDRNPVYGVLFSSFIIQ